MTDTDDEKVGNELHSGTNGRSVAENPLAGISRRVRKGAVANARIPIDDRSATRNQVAGDAENAVAFHESLDERQLAAQPVVGALESTHMRCPETGAGSVEKTVKSAEKSGEHASSYAAPH